MKDNNQSYSKLIDCIRAAHSDLDDAQKLTDNIMSAVAKSPRRRAVSLPLRVVSWVSSVAAVLLVGLFVAQYPVIETTDYQPINSSIAYSYSTILPVIEKDDVLDQINEIITQKQIAHTERAAFRASIAPRDK